jgi:hypothetical protein
VMYVHVLALSGGCSNVPRGLVGGLAHILLKLVWVRVGFGYHCRVYCNVGGAGGVSSLEVLD